MSFNTDQHNALIADLDRRHVSQRTQAGRQLSYIEGWHAISEANRIFGFDGWASETVSMHLAASGERQSNGRTLQTCTYTARCRVTVYAGDRVIVREGVGAGHGMDQDAGQAHEKAVKEAETDSRKRALMTFGNQFGLALYDKTQANVSDAAPEPRSAAPVAAKPAPPAPTKEAAGAPSLPQRGGNKEPAGSRPYHPADAKPHSRITHNDLVSKLSVYYAGLSRNGKTLPIARENLAKWEKAAKPVWANMNKFDADRVAKEREKFLALISEVEGAGAASSAAFEDEARAAATKAAAAIDPESGEIKEAAA